MERYTIQDLSGMIQEILKDLQEFQDDPDRTALLYEDLEELYEEMEELQHEEDARFIKKLSKIVRKDQKKYMRVQAKKRWMQQRHYQCRMKKLNF
jgi:hypothetical protein